MLIDCNPICYAAFHTTGPLTYNNLPTGVIYGFLKRMFDLSYKFKTNRLIFFWDARKTYKEEFYPEYKHKRREAKDQMEAEDIVEFRMMIDQMVKLNHKVLPSLGFRNSFVFHGYEADDIIAHVLNKKKLKGRKIIISNDADLYQLLDRADMYLHMTEKVFTQRDFVKKYGIKVNQWVLAKSIGGCNSDDIVGIEGVSDPKSPSSKALKYIREELPHGVIYDRITSKEGKKIIKRNIRLNKVPFKPKKIPPIRLRQDCVSLKKITKCFVDHGFQSLCERDYFSKIREIFG